MAWACVCATGDPQRVTWVSVFLHRVGTAQAMPTLQASDCAQRPAGLGPLQEVKLQ